MSKAIANIIIAALVVVLAIGFVTAKSEGADVAEVFSFSIGMFCSFCVFLFFFTANPDAKVKGEPLFKLNSDIGNNICHLCWVCLLGTFEVICAMMWLPDILSIPLLPVIIMLCSLVILLCGFFRFALSYRRTYFPA